MIFIIIMLLLYIFILRKNKVKVREKYFESFEKEKSEENIIIVDGNRSQEEIAKEIWNKISEYFI